MIALTSKCDLFKCSNLKFPLAIKHWRNSFNLPLKVQREALNSERNKHDLIEIDT